MLGFVLGFVPADRVVDVCEKIVTIQRDWDNRENRKFSRLKYTLDRVGLDVFRAEPDARLGYPLEPARPYQFRSSGDAYGWAVQVDGRAHLTLFVEGGRVQDQEKQQLKTALREIAGFHTSDFRLTGNQNLIIANIAPEHRLSVQTVLQQRGVAVEAGQQYTGLRRGALACVARPTCTLAFAEAERYLPEVLDRLDEVIQAQGLAQDDILLRMTGCPNGCSRPYLGEIGLVGRAVGRYNLYLGTAFNGERTNKLYKEMLDENVIIQKLTPLPADYAQHRQPQERSGDFVIRRDYVQPTASGLTFHK